MPSVTAPITVEALALHPQHMATLAHWFETEWPGWYMPGRGQARQDLQTFSNLGSLPLGLVALRDGQPVGCAVLKAQSFETHRHLSPWAAAGYVLPALRRQGIGLQLLRELEARARALGFAQIYCGTGSAERLLTRAGWEVFERFDHEGKPLTIHVKPL